MSWKYCEAAASETLAIENRVRQITTQIQTGGDQRTHYGQPERPYELELAQSARIKKKSRLKHDHDFHAIFFFFNNNQLLIRVGNIVKRPLVIEL